jgi:branched-chain amino acid transport system permease protein
LVAENLASKPRIQGHWNLIIQLVLLLIFVLLPLVVHYSPYYISLMITVGMYAILAMAFVLLLRTGLYTLAIAAFWGVGAYSSAMLVMKAHLSFWLALPSSAIMTGVLALFFGFLLIRNPGFGFVIMTMLIGLLFVVLVGSTKWLGGYSGILNIPAPDPIHIPFLSPIEFVSSTTYYYLLLFLFVVVVLVFSAFYASSIGRAWTAIGLNSQLAASLGINVFRYRLLAFVVSCTTTGLIGSFYAHFIGYIQPSTFNMFKTIYVQVHAILGGIGFPFLGPLIGSTVMVFFPEFMRITREIEPIITGALLVLLMIFLPSGVLSLPGVRALATDPVRSVAKIGKRIKSLVSR